MDEEANDRVSRNKLLYDLCLLSRFVGRPRWEYRVYRI